MVQHRKPPKPESWNCQRGTCRLCGEAIIENGKPNNRKHWHKSCGETWRIMNNPSVAREHVLKRDKLVCQCCNVRGFNVQFEVDHKKPLFEAEGDLDYWMPDNLILLCKDCHLDKTRVDMGRYRAAKTKTEPVIAPPTKRKKPAPAGVDPAMFLLGLGQFETSRKRRR